MRDKVIFLAFAFLLPALLFVQGCDTIDNSKLEPPVLTLEETLSAICARKEYSDSLQTRFEVDTLARSLVENYMVHDSSFSQSMIKYQRNLEAHHGTVNWKPIATGIKIDLDEDPEKEVICFLGISYSSPRLLVFDYVNGGYKKVLDEHLWLHNEHPRLKILRLGRRNIFRTGHFYYRGSGHWLYAYQCYAMFEGKYIKWLSFLIERT